jgi:hypothetical protein
MRAARQAAWALAGTRTAAVAPPTARRHRHLGKKG